jgi:hypothetical protein
MMDHGRNSLRAVLGIAAIACRTFGQTPACHSAKVGTCELCLLYQRRKRFLEASQRSQQNHGIALSNFSERSCKSAIS